MQVFVITNKDGMKINADVNANNWLTNECLIKDLFGILVIVIVSVMSENIYKIFIDYTNCMCGKRLIDKLVGKFSKNIDEKELHSRELHSSKMIFNGTLIDYQKICGSCTVYAVLFVILFIKVISISSVFIYFHWYLKGKHIETTIYWIQFHWTYKWEVLSKLIWKIVHITFLMTWSILKTLIRAY